MKNLLLTAAVLTLGIGTVQAGVEDYTPEQIKEMSRYAGIEQQRCPKSRYQSVKKRLACKKEVRVEIYEKRKAREDRESNDG